MRVLVIEDERALQENLAAYLEPEMTLDFASSGPEGLGLALAHPYDVIVLDLALPGMDGLDVCRRLRDAAPQLVPVLMLTARDTLEDKEAGFAAGADDYLVKPFSLRELAWRLRALGRRPVPPSGHTLRFGALRFEPATGWVQRGAERVRLQRTEALVLRALLEAAPHPVPVATLAERLWGDAPPEGSALRTHVYGLRKALGRLGLEALVVHRRNEGYGLDASLG